MTRIITRRYEDPVDLIWRACAHELGIRIVRSDAVYASYDGASTLTLTTPGAFDADDSLAQLILHELCHGLVASPRKRKQADWGMENVDARDLVTEHACHRVQARLLDECGLRGLLAVTTEHRPYWDALPHDPLAPSDDPALPLARDAYDQAKHGPWAAAIARALTRTRQVADAVRGVAHLHDDGLASVWAAAQAMHESGFPAGDHGEVCGDCAWSVGEGARRSCRQTRADTGGPMRRVAADATGCVRFEQKLDDDACARCGACCRQAFDRVEVSAREPLRKRHPQLVVVDGFGAHLPRPGGHCVALASDGENTGYRCTIYDERPRSCALFAVAGDACLTARRRVGLSC